MALVYSWEQRIEKVDSVIAAMQSVKDTFRAAQRYEKQQKKDLLDVALMVTRINTMLSGVSTTLSAAVEDTIAELIANNPGLWQIDIGPEDIYFAGDEDERGFISVAASPTDPSFSAYGVSDFFGSFLEDDIIEVYNAEDPTTSKRYLFGTAGSSFMYAKTTAGWTRPTLGESADLSIRFKLKER